MSNIISKKSPGYLLRNMVVNILLVLMLGLLAGCLNVNAANHQQMQQIQQKAQMAQKGVIERKRSGRDVSELLKLMSQVKPNMDNKNVDKAESILDEVLSLLESDDSPAISDQGNSRKDTDEYGSPEVVNIKGYSGDAMEPFVSRDGKYLFFNNLNDPDVNTNIYYAERTAGLNYEFRGEIKGVNTGMLEGVPSMDRSGRFCFVSDRKSNGPFSTTYCGDFRDGEVRNVHNFQEPSGKQPPWFNMDFEISPDGEYIYYSENEIVKGSRGPRSSNLAIALKNNGGYKKLANSNELMKNINTGELEYAPSISEDGLELSFTRASELIVGNQSAGKDLRILIAKRKSLNEPFGVPREIDSIRGFVEGPTMIDNGNTIYFHKRDGSRFAIYRVNRK